MASKRKAVILTLKTWAILRRMIRDYVAGRLTNRPPRPDEGRGGTGGSRLIAAIASADIAPGATGTFYLADPAFAATVDEKDATNDSLQTIPIGTKCYLGKVRPLSGLRVVQAFICGPPPETP
jgi:hypothetical protein